MRVAPLFLVVFLCAASAFGQQQEEKLSQRLMRKPDQNLEYDLRKSSFGGTRSFSAGSARTKDFYVKQKYSPKEFNAKSYSGTKTAWMGDFKYKAGEANTRGKYEIPNVAKKADTKTMAVKDARDGNKTMATREFDKANRQYLGPEAAKVHKAIPMNEQPTGWTGDLRPMTIDDVRELLNKNE